MAPPTVFGTELPTFSKHCETECGGPELECAMHCLDIIITKHTCRGAAWGDAVVWAIIASRSRCCRKLLFAPPVRALCFPLVDCLLLPGLSGQ